MPTCTAVTNRISNFVMPVHPYTSRTFCERKTTVDFLSLTEAGKITAFRAASNQLSDDSRRVVAATIVLNLFPAFGMREKIYMNRGASHPVRLVIEGFQIIAGLETLDIILSEARKHGLSLIAATSATHIPEDLLKPIEGDSKLIISFR